jgi:hypothetical protein
MAELMPTDLLTFLQLMGYKLGVFVPHHICMTYKGFSDSAGKLCREKINGDPQHSGLPPTDKSSSATPPY